MVFVQRIVVNLLANGEKAAQKEPPMRRLERMLLWPNKIQGWKEIVYTLQEEKVAEYTTATDQGSVYVLIPIPMHLVRQASRSLQVG